MSRYFSRDIAGAYKQAFEIAKDVATKRFNHEVCLWKGDFTIKDEWYTNRKKAGVSVKSVKLFGMCGVSVIVKVKEGVRLTKTLAKFFFGFTKREVYYIAKQDKQ